MTIIIYPPEGTKFAQCEQCKNPYVQYDKEEICIWCEIHKEEKNE